MWPFAPRSPRLKQRLAFDRLYDEHFTYVWTMVRRLGVHDPERQDLVQDVFLNAHRDYAKFTPARGSEQQWLHGITWNLVSNYKQRARHRREQHAADEDFEQVAADRGWEPEERFMADEVRRLVREIYRTIPDDCLDIMLAYYIDGMRMEEIAEQHKIPTSTAYKKCARGRELFEQRYTQMQNKDKSRGALVLALSFEKLLDSDRPLVQAPEAVRRHVWHRLRRAIPSGGHDAPDNSSGQSAPSVQRAAPSLARAAPSLARAALSGVPVVTFIAGTVAGYALNTATHRPAEPTGRADVAVAAAAPIGSVEPPPVPSGASTAGATSAPSASSARTVAETTRPDAGAPARDDFEREQKAFDRAKAAYDHGYYDEAIKLFQEQAQVFAKNGQLGSARERYLTLTLIRAGRTAEARQRIEALRRANPNSPALKEFDAALPTRQQP